MGNQWLGNTFDKIGTGLGLPELGISEALAGKKYTIYSGITPQSVKAGVPSPYQGQNISIAMNPGTTKYYRPAAASTGNPVQTSSVSGGQVQGVQTSSDGSGGSNAVTEKQALEKGWDINNLPSGYVRAQEGPSGEDRAREEARLEAQRQKVRDGINNQANSYFKYLDSEIGNLPKEEEEGQKYIEGQYNASTEAVDREKRRNTREVGEQIIQLMRSGNDRFGSVGAGNSSATQVMLPYALGRESAKANAKIAEVALTQTKAIESEKNQMLYDLKTQVNDVRRRFQELRANADGQRLQALTALEENTLANLESDARSQLAELRNRSSALKDWVTQRTAQLNDYKMQGYKVDPLSQVQEEVSSGNDFINPVAFAGIKKKQDDYSYS